MRMNRNFGATTKLSERTVAQNSMPYEKTPVSWPIDFFSDHLPIDFREKGDGDDDLQLQQNL